MATASYDVLIVGGGGAGLRAAIAVLEAEPRLSVAIVSKVYPMRSHTVSAEGGAAAVIRSGDTLEEHAHDTIAGGDWLCDQDAVEAFVKEAPRSCSGSSTGAARGAASPMGTSPSVRSAA